jgi:hypothetical protein
MELLPSLQGNRSPRGAKQAKDGAYDRSPSPVGVISNKQPHLVLVARNINTQNIPIFRFLEFIESQGMNMNDCPKTRSLSHRA